MTKDGRLKAAPPEQRLPLTAHRVALAVVASARVYGDDPARAMDHASHSRLRRSIAAAALGLQAVTGQPLKAVCGILGVYGSNVATARRAGGELFECAKAAAETAIQGGLPPTPPPPPPGRLTAASVALPLSPKPASPALRAAKAAVEGPSFAPTPAPSPAPNPAHGRRLQRAVRMMPVTPSKLRFAKRFLAAHWDLEEVAFLFDVSPDALAAAFRPEAA